MIKTLIVDDNPGFLKRLREFLNSQNKYEIVGEANDGEEAILKALNLKPDLVLMDVRMVGMNGLSATQRLKDEFPDLVIIILSSYDLQEYRVAAKNRGASAYVVKTNMVKDLHPTIQSVMAEQNSRNAD